MVSEKKILAIIGSASANSTNERLVAWIANQFSEGVKVTIFNDLKSLPHFDPELSITETPEPVLAIRSVIDQSDAVLICTPEYVFSIPSGLKNLIEWCVSTTVFSDKLTGLITASANGQKGHEELQLIMGTVMADFNEDTSLLIQGVKGKVDAQGEITDEKTRKCILRFTKALEDRVMQS